MIGQTPSATSEQLKKSLTHGIKPQVRTQTMNGVKHWPELAERLSINEAHVDSQVMCMVTSSKRFYVNTPMSGQTSCYLRLLELT